MVSSLPSILKKLDTYKSSKYPILSLFFTLPENSQKQSATLHTQLHTLIQENLSSQDKKTFFNELSYVEGLFSEKKNFNHGSRGLAIYAGGNKLWEIVTTLFPLPATLHIDHSPYIAPLQKELKIHNRYLVVLADREKAKFFMIRSGIIEAQDEVHDNSVPQNVKSNEENYYGRSDKIFRHIQDHLNRHFDVIASRLTTFVKNRPINSVIVGGHSQMIHKTEEYLPRNLQKRVVAEFITGLNDSMKSITDKSMHIIEKLQPPVSLS